MKTLRNISLVIVAAMSFAAPTWAGDSESAAAPTLYERLGGIENIERIVYRTIANHLRNPDVAHFFADVDIVDLTSHVSAFFAAGTGGPNNYTGRDMTSAHAGRNMSSDEFDSAIADVLKSCEQSGIGEPELGEVKAILFSLKPAVMGTAGE